MLLVGQKAWAKSKKKERRVIMTDMRLVTHLILRMRVFALQPTLKGEDLVDRNHFDCLTQAIQSLSKNEDYREEKSALELALGYTLKKKVIKLMKGYYMQKNNMERESEVGFQLGLYLLYRELAVEQRKNSF